MGLLTTIIFQFLIDIISASLCEKTIEKPDLLTKIGFFLILFLCNKSRIVAYIEYFICS